MCTSIFDMVCPKQRCLCVRHVFHLAARRDAVRCQNYHVTSAACTKAS